MREFVYEGDCVALGGVTHLIPPVRRCGRRLVVHGLVSLNVHLLCLTG